MSDTVKGMWLAIGILVGSFLLGLWVMWAAQAQEAPHWPSGPGWYAIITVQASRPHVPGVYNWQPVDQDTCFEILASEDFTEVSNNWIDYELGEHPGEKVVFGKPQCVEVKAGNPT